MINTIQKLAEMAIELGGSAYKAAERGGILSASRFLSIHTEGDNGKMPENVKVVTEVYVRFEGREELDRIFLYAEGMQSDKELMRAGCIEDGKLVVAYDKLTGLAERGYMCFYHRSPDGHNGRAFAYYHAAFGEKKCMLPFKMWDSSAEFVGNGHNRALLVTTAFESVFVMPDIRTVRKSIKDEVRNKEVKDNARNVRDKEVIEQMKVKDIALVYDFNELRVAVALTEKCPDNTLRLLHRIEMEAPEIQEIPGADLEQFVKDDELRALGIDDKRPADRKALENIRRDRNRVKRQLRRNDSAVIIFDNGYWYVTMDYPIERLEKCYAPILKNSEVIMDRLFEETGVSKIEVSVVILAGENGEYPFVKKYLEQYTGKTGVIVNWGCTLSENVIL